MYCSHCGTEIEPDSNFCKKCGLNIQDINKEAEKKTNNKSKYPVVISAICIILVGCLIWSLTGRKDSTVASDPVEEQMGEIDTSSKTKQTSAFLSIEEVTFATPEAAIEHFSQKVAENDLLGAMQACAVENMGYYDFPKGIERQGGYTLNCKWPGKYDMYQDLNRMTYMGECAQWIKMMIWSIKIPEIDGTTPLGTGEASKDGGELVGDTSLFEERLSPMSLSDLKLVEIASDYISEEKMEKVSKMNQQNAALYGAQDLVERGVLYSYQGVFYLGGYELLETEKGWKIKSFGAPFLGVGWGGMESITMEEWNQILNEKL